MFFIIIIIIIVVAVCLYFYIFNKVHCQQVGMGVFIIIAATFTLPLDVHK